MKFWHLAQIDLSLSSATTHLVDGDGKSGETDEEPDHERLAFRSQAAVYALAGAGLR